VAATGGNAGETGGTSAATTGGTGGSGGTGDGSGGTGRGSGGTGGTLIVVGGGAGSGGAVSHCFEPSGAPGTLDTTFADAGVSTITSPNDQGTEILTDLALESDGKLVVLGLDNAGMVLFRLAADGSLDEGFGSDGFFAGGTGDSGNAIALDAHDNVLVAGSNIKDAWVERITPDGTLDPTFGDAGRVTLDLGTDNDRFETVLVRSDGSLVVAGTSDSNGPQTTTFIVPLSADGTPLADSAAMPGLRPSDNRYFPVALAEASDHSVMVLGAVMPSSGGTEHPFWAKLDAKGALATDYGQQGILEIGDALGTVIGLTRGADGSLAGYVSGMHYALDAYDTAGNKTAFSAVSAVSPIGVALDCAGDVLVAGVYTNNGFNAGGVERFSPSGKLDLAFGDSTIAKYVVDGEHAGLERVLVLPNGKIVAAGETAEAFSVRYYLP
jgi:uncharacterized delta-60 repeat protein